MGAVISSILYQPYQGHLMFFCPGCNQHHVVKVKNNDDGKGWEWNRDIMFPTFKPAYRVEFAKPTLESLAMIKLLLPVPQGQDRYPCTDEICHSNIVDGGIHFLSDCTHSLAGKLVPLPPHGFKP